MNTVALTRINLCHKGYSLWVTAALCIAATFYVGVAPIVYNDFWMQTKIGEIVWQHHQIPTSILFPYTEIAAENFNPHEWLASVFFYLAVQIWGEAGLPVLLGLLSSVLFGSVVVLAYQRNGGHIEAALGCGLMAIWAENYRHWLRPELIAIVVMVWFWICVDHYLRTRSRRTLTAALALTIVWTNCHGSFILAPIIVGFYASDLLLRDWRRAGSIAEWKRLMCQPELQLMLLVLLATVVNPFGIHMHAFVLQFSTEAYVRDHIPEWARTLDARHTDPRGFYIGMGIWVITFLRLLLDAWRRQWHLIEFFSFLAFSALGFYSIRFLVYFGVVAAFVYSAKRNPAAYFSRETLQRTLVSVTALVSLLLAFAYGNAYRASPLIPPANVKFTPGLVQILGNSHLKGNVLNSLELGAELVFRAYPRLKPSLDSRIDSYGLDYIMFQRALLEDESLLKEYVARYDVRYVLLDVVRFEIFARQPSWQRGDWRVLYRSSKEVFLIRHDLPNPPNDVVPQISSGV